MILRIALGEYVEVAFDDEITDQRATPEQVEDYLTRMARTAGRLWGGMEDEPVSALTEPDESA